MVAYKTRVDPNLPPAVTGEVHCEYNGQCLLTSGRSRRLSSLRRRRAAGKGGSIEPPLARLRILANSLTSHREPRSGDVLDCASQKVFLSATPPWPSAPRRLAISWPTRM